MQAGAVSEKPDVLLPVVAGVALVPTEQVLLLAVALPGMSAPQRKAAVAFAVEDHIAAMLDAVHVILGPALKGNGNGNGAQWLVAVISKAALPAPSKSRLVPDVLLLPVPAPQQWSVWTNGTRVLVRTPDGAGFGTDAAMLPYYHLAAGRPDIVLFAGVLDAQFPIAARADMPQSLDPALQGLDLNAGRAPAGPFANGARWRPLIAVAAVAAVAHLALMVADVWALGQIRAMQRADLQTTLATIGQPASGDLDADVAAVLAQANGADGAGFVQLAAQAFGAMQGAQGQVTASDLRYAADPRSLSLQLQAPDIATLQDVETALTNAGFAVTAGAATTRDGLAEQQLTLTGGGGT